MTSSVPERPAGSAVEEEVSTEELARRQGVRPVTSLAALARPDAWESEQEFQDFLADLYASRHSDAS
ncbi:MAG TPA: hypothetical protein VMU51_31140 [Mycobacteriales bacterium]|nr:hypothetical protein [Mycobacteriales bacterium]